MELKKCKHCSTEFTDDTSRGSEKLYCSIKCRTEAGTIRRENNLKNKIRQEYETKNSITETQNYAREHLHTQLTNDNHLQRGNIYTNRQGNNNEYSVFGLLERNYEEKTNSLEYKLKNEMLVKENEALQKEILILNEELDDLETEQEQKGGGLLSGFVEQFKTDPSGTINFATEIINTYLKKPVPKNDKK